MGAGMLGRGLTLRARRMVLVLGVSAARASAASLVAASQAMAVSASQATAYSYSSTSMLGTPQARVM